MSAPTPGAVVAEGRFGAPPDPEVYNVATQEREKGEAGKKVEKAFPKWPCASRF